MAPYTIHNGPAAVDADGDGQRPCARGSRCLESASVLQPDGRRTNEPALGYRTLCDSDRAFALTCIEALPGYYRELGGRIGDKQQGHGPRVSGSREAPIPVNPSVDELRVDLINIVASWTGRILHVARIVGEVDPDRPASHYTLEDVGRMCGTLAAHLDALLTLDAGPMTRFMPIGDADDLPDGTPIRRNHWTQTAQAIVDLSGADAALETFRLNARCRWFLGHTGKDEKIGGRCFACDQLDVLVRPDSAAGLQDHAECSACGARYFDAEYTMLLRAAYEAELARQQHAS